MSKLESKIVITFSGSDTLEYNGKLADAICEVIDSAGERGSNWTTPIYLDNGSLVINLQLMTTFYYEEAR